MGNQKGCVLCVDNQHEVCELIAIVLNAKGYEVVSVDTYKKGLNQALSKGFDLYIISGGLPGQAGIRLSREVRAVAPQTPIVFSTAGNDKEEVLAAQAAGVTYILIKPFRLEQFEEVISGLLSDG